MAERIIADFLVLVGNDFDEECESFKLFRIENVSVKNKMYIFNVVAVDVHVRMSGGMALWSIITGNPVVLGDVDLSKKRQVAVEEDLVYCIKDAGNPSVYMAFPDRYERLPASIKNSRLGNAFQIYLLERNMLERQREMMEQADYSETEILDKVTESQTKFAQYVNTLVQSYSKSEEARLQQDVEGKRQKTGEEQGGGFY